MPRRVTVRCDLPGYSCFVLSGRGAVKKYFHRPPVIKSAAFLFLTIAKGEYPADFRPACRQVLPAGTQQSYHYQGYGQSKAACYAREQHLRFIPAQAEVQIVRTDYKNKQKKDFRGIIQQLPRKLPRGLPRLRWSVPPGLPAGHRFCFWPWRPSVGHFPCSARKPRLPGTGRTSYYGSLPRLPEFGSCSVLFPGCICCADSVSVPSGSPSRSFCRYSSCA